MELQQQPTPPEAAVIIQYVKTHVKKVIFPTVMKSHLYIQK